MTTHSAGPVKARHHVAEAIQAAPSRIRREMREVDGVNAKIAVLITKLVGSMATQTQVRSSLRTAPGVRR